MKPRTVPRAAQKPVHATLSAIRRAVREVAAEQVAPHWKEFKFKREEPFKIIRPEILQWLRTSVGHGGYLVDKGYPFGSDEWWNGDLWKIAIANISWTIVFRNQEHEVLFELTWC